MGSFGIHRSEEERMGMWLTARPSQRLRVARALGALGAALLASAALGVSAASADAGKVLVFTGTAGTANPSTPAAATAIQALAAANDFTATVSSAATDINDANLAGYRAVVFVNSSGDVLSAAQETSLQNYVQQGGGFVGIGDTALLEQGGTDFFNTLIGLAAARGTLDATSGAQDVEFLDRVNPATRNDPLVASQTSKWYSWATNPTGTVHTVARVRFNTIPGGSSVTNDAIARFTGMTATLQPQLERPAAWCRDVQQGRSFYTMLGGTEASYANADLQKHLLGAIQWASGMVRGNCKATITSNYQTTRITPPNPAGQNSNFTGELTNSAIADDGRVFYTGRAVCYAGQVQNNNWSQANVALGCGTIHVYDPNVAGTDNQNPAKIAKVGELQVFGAKGGGAETGPTSKVEQGLLAVGLDPKFTKGRPYIYIQYFPYFGGEQGYNTTPKLGNGFIRSSFMAERRTSRFTYDPATKSLVPGSEKVIISWMTQVYSCCHVGSSMAWDTAGNLYISNGDNTGNSPNSNNGGYTNSALDFTIPCDGGAVGTACGLTDTACTGTGVGQQAACGHISFADARQTSGNTNNYEGKLIRIHPVDSPGDTPGIGSTYTIPGADAPNGPNLFAPDSTAVTSGKAKPEVFAMGTRNLYTLHVDSKTNMVTTAWVGPDQGLDSDVWGTAKTENATIMKSAGNYGWPYCQAGNRHYYRAKLPSATGGGAPAPAGLNGTVGGGADGQTGGYWDCSKELVNDSPFNNGMPTVPKPKPVNIWYGPHGGCYDYPKNANGVDLITNGTGGATGDPGPATYDRCPWLIGGSQAPIDGGIYRKPAGDKPNAWPAYWDGRWFLGDFSSSNNLRHALLMDPATEANGGQPVAVDSLLPIIPALTIGNNRLITMNFGPDGALYVGSYSGSFFSINPANTGLWKFSYVGGPDTPGPDPKAATNPTSSKVDYNIGKSGGISYKWDFDDGASATGANVSHSYLTGGSHSAKLTVTYADGETASATVAADVPPSQSTTVSGTVAPTLALTLGPQPGFGTFTLGVANTYNASTTANVLSSGGDATLSVTDANAQAPGHLVNGTFVMPQALKARATNATNSNTTFANVSGTPLTLLTYPGPIANDAVSLQFQQAIGSTDPLRTGQYAKTLTFTLSTTTP
jgi:type 1 glutamine amidotransferase